MDEPKRHTSHDAHEAAQSRWVVALRRSSPVRTVGLVLLPLIVFTVSIFLGRYPLSPLTVLKVLASRALPIEPTWPDVAETIVFQIRLPRALLAGSVGASLAISGAAFQGMFRNPLVSSQILGVSAGAGFGAALAILIAGNPVVVQASAFAFGLAAVALTYTISRVYRTTPTLMLVLSGIVVGALFAALISLVTFVADPFDELPTIVFWLMGSLSSASNGDVVSTLPLMIAGTAGLLLVRWRLNVLSMGDEQARSLGVNTEVLKRFVIVCATVVSAAAVSVTGIIGWVGLVIPHIARMLFGADHRVVLPASISLGSAYLLAVDDLARSATTVEIPLSIVTAIIGAPFFAYLLRRTRGAWFG